MEEFIPGQVYENLVKMMKYRAVTLTNPPLDQDILVQKLNHYEFVTLSGTRAKIPDDPRAAASVICILIAPNSKYSGKSGDFKKLLKNLPKTKPNENLEVIFISEVDFTIHIKKHLQQYKLENPKILLEDYNYEIFMIEAPKHVFVPQHEVATEKEIDQYCAIHFTSKDRFPKILQSDPQAVWLGLRPGMCTKVIRMSETAGSAVFYRICVRG